MAGKKKSNKPEPTAPKPLTLADVTITWTYGNKGDETRTITGRQLSQMIFTEAEKFPTDSSFGDTTLTGAWVYKLRGLSALVFPDAGTSIHEGDARAFVSDVLDDAAAEIWAGEM